MVNPFYVAPGNQMAEGLTGLGQTLQQYGQIKQTRQKEDEAKQRLIQGAQAAKAAYESGDPDAMAKVALEYPEMSQGMDAAYKFKTDATRENMVQGMRRVLSGEDPNAVFEERVRAVAEAGGDPSDTVLEWQRYRENPEASLNNIKMSFAALDPKGYEAMFSTEKPSAIEQKLVAAGYQPGTPEYQAAARRLLEKSGGTTVNIGAQGPGGFGADPNKFSEKLAEKQANQWEAQTEKASSAEENIAMAGELEAMLSNGLETGALAPARAGIDKFTKDAFGFSLTGMDPGKAERFEGISVKLARQMREPGEGEMTDSDAKAYQKVIGGLGTSVEANQAAIGAFKKAQQRSMEKAQEMDAWIEKTGTLTGFKEYWNKYMKQNPLFKGNGGGPDGSGAGIEVGTVQDGYIYLGGNPADPESWSKAR